MYRDKIKAYNAVCLILAADAVVFCLVCLPQHNCCIVFMIMFILSRYIFENYGLDVRDAVFGDGAGAAVLSHANVNEGFLAFRLYSDGRGKWNYTVPGGGSEYPMTEENVKKGLQFFQMNGRAVYETGTKVLPQAIKQVLSDTGLTINDIDYMIPHQPSIKILQKTAEIIGLPFEKVMTIMEKYANTSGGTIPILLDEVNRAGKLTKGKIILFAAVGSGWTWGASIIKWH